MVKILVKQTGSKICEMIVRGHAFYADPGNDIVCAGISAITIGGINALDELYNGQAGISLSENEIRIQEIGDGELIQNACRFLLRQLACMQEEYPRNIKIIRKEV